MAVEEGIYGGYQQARAKYEKLRDQFEKTAPALSDLPDIEKLLISLASEREQPLERCMVMDAGASVSKLCAVDLDGDGRNEVVLLDNNGIVQLYQFAPTMDGFSQVRAARPAAAGGQALCIIKNRDAEGYTAGLLIAEGEGPRSYYNIYLHDDFSALELFRRPPPIRQPVVLRASQLTGRGQPLKIEVLLAESGSPFDCTLRAQGINLPDYQGQAVYQCQHAISAAVYDDTGILLGGTRTRILHLPFNAIQAEQMQPDGGFTGRVSGYVNALAGRIAPDGTVEILAACDDGWLIALDRHTGEERWKRRLPDVPLALDIADINGDGETELIIGCRDGSLSVWKFLPGEGIKAEIDAWSRAAAGWAAQARGEEYLAARWRASDHPVLAQLAEQYGPGHGPAETIPLPSLENQLDFNLLWRMPAFGSLEALHACFCPETGKTWLLAATRAGMLLLIDVVKHRIAGRLDLGSAGPVRAISSAAVIDQEHPELAVLTADGAVRLYLPARGLDLNRPACQWKTPGEAWSMVFLRDQLGALTVFTGSGRGWLEETLVTEGKAKRQGGFSTGSRPLHHLALLRDASGSIRLVAADGQNPGFSIYTKENPSSKRYVDMPQAVIELLSWPASDGSIYTAAVCADQQVFVFNEWGELIHLHFPDEPGPYFATDEEDAGWAEGELGVRSDIFSLDFDAENPNLLTATGDRLVVYRREGERLAELHLGIRVEKLKGFYWNNFTGQRCTGLAAATPEGEIFFYEAPNTRPNCAPDPDLAGFDNGMDLAQSLAEVIARAARPEQACKILSYLGTFAQSGPGQAEWVGKQAAEMATFEGLSPKLRACYVESLVRVMNCVDAQRQEQVGQVLKQILAGPRAGMQYDRRVLMAITKQAILDASSPLPAGWITILDQLAASQDAITLRGLAQMAVAGLEKKPPERYWWKIIQAATSGEDITAASKKRGAKEVAREAVALHLRNVHQPDPARAWHSAHLYLENGMDPRVLSTLSRQEVPLIIKELPVRELYAALAEFMNQHCAQKLDALTALGAAIHKQGSWVEEDYIANAYLGLLRLFQAADDKDLRQEMDRPWTVKVIDWLRNGGESGKFEELSRALNESFELVRTGLEKYDQMPFEKRLEYLRELSTHMELQADRLSDQARQLAPTGRYTTLNWIECLAMLMREWVQSHGWLGHWIYEHQYEFRWDVEISNPRFQENEFLAEFAIKNEGFSPAFDILILPPELTVGGITFTGEAKPAPGQKTDLLKPGERILCTLRAALPPELSGRMVEEVPIVFRLSRPSGQDGSKVSVVERMARITNRREQIDYPVDFPSSWKVHEKRMRELLNRHSGLIFVELDRVARHSFFQALLSQMPAGKGRMVSLRKVFQQVKSDRSMGGRPLKVRAEDLVSGIAADLTGSAQPVGFGPTYRTLFLQVLLSGPRPVEKLFLDQFDDVVLRMMEEEEGLKTLRELLDSLRELVDGRPIQVVLGGSYLVLKFIQSDYPDVYHQLEVVRPDYLQASGTGQQEIQAFLTHEVNLRGLDLALSLFTPPADLAELAGWCGANLTYLRFFLLDGLEQALRDADTPAGQARLAQTTAINYLAEYARQQNFFGLMWVSLSFYEKIALTLLAQAQFAVTRKEMLNEIAGLRLSQPYRPPLPPDRHTGEQRYSRKTEGQVGQVIDEELITKIRSSKYFTPEDVWVSGFASKSALYFERSRTGMMLWRMLRATCLDALVAQFEQEGIIERRGSARELGDIFTFRIPLFREFFLRGGAYERMVSIAGGTKHKGWYPQDLLPPANPFTGERKIEPVYAKIPVNDLLALNAAFREAEDLDLFLNFYDMPGSPDIRRRRWEKAVTLTRALRALADHFEQVVEDDTRKTFEALNDLLEVRHAEMQPGLDAGPGRQSIHNQWVVWQYTHFDEGVFPGLSKNLLIAFVKDGSSWDYAGVAALRDWSLHYHHLAMRAELGSPGEPENGQSDAQEKLKEKEQSVVVVVALQNARVLEQRVREGTRQTELHYVVLGDPELGELFRSEFPAQALVRLIQRQVGRSAFSPYKTRGALEPGSPLFVGRQAELIRILQGIDRNTYIILGSRRIGKTSLLRQIQSRLARDPRYLPLWVGIPMDAEDFFARMRSVLKQSPWKDTAYLLSEGPAAYEGLRQALYALKIQSQKMPVLLLDEVDGLHRSDKQQHERLFSTLRDITQGTPPICRLVMTGYRQIYFQQFVHGSVFFNFGERVFLREVEDRDLTQLINLLKNYSVELYHDDEARKIILEKTYGIPYLVQKACGDLLERLDDATQARADRDRIEREDITAVLKNVGQDLYNELIANIRIDAESEARQEEIRLRMRLILFSAVLGKYPYSQEQSAGFRPLAESERYFTAVDVVNYLQEWADQAQPYWHWNYEEIYNLLQELQMTLALSVDPAQQEETRFYFPRDIVPRVLQDYFQSGRRGSILDRLQDTIESYIQLVKSTSR